MIINKLSCVVPVHNEALNLKDEVSMALSFLKHAAPMVDILLVENGSKDRSYEVAKELESIDAGENVRVIACQEERAGIGFAYHRGMHEALTMVQGSCSGHWVLLTAADFPFGSSDLVGFLAALNEQSDQEIYIGSKAHSESNISVTRKRKILSWSYKFVRRVLLGMRTGDCQGTVFIHAPLAATILPKIQARDFFYSTELVFLAEKLGKVPVELPVSLRPSIRPSTVNAIRDSVKMFKQLIALKTHNGRIS